MLSKKDGEETLNIHCHTNQIYAEDGRCHYGYRSSSNEMNVEAIRLYQNLLLSFAIMI